jgi:hypothetical protein
MNRAGEVVVEGWQNCIQFPSTVNMARQVKYDVGLYRLDNVTHRNQIRDICLPPLDAITF